MQPDDIVCVSIVCSANFTLVTETYARVDSVVFVDCVPAEVRLCSIFTPAYPHSLSVTSVIFETVLFALTMHVAVSRMSAREDISDLLLTLFRDGILYFLAVSGRGVPFNLVQASAYGKTL